MSLFANLQGDEPRLSDDDISTALEQVKKNARMNRWVMVAPVLFAAAIVGAFVASPPTYSDLLVTEAEASDDSQLPRVFGANGVWNFAEPIGEDPEPTSGPASMVEAPVDSLAPSYVLVPPSDSHQSFPVSASTPPSPTPEQSADPDASATLVLESAGVDWSTYTPVIRVEPPVVSSEVTAPEPETTATTDATAETSSVASSQAVNAGIPGEVYPSLPPQGSSLDTSQPASIVPVSVLVHSARVTVRVQVIDEDSPYIDSCNTFVDWGDGTISGVTTTGDSAVCGAACNAETTATGINAELLFEHDYDGVIDADPRVYVATGDGCTHQLAELGLPRIAVVPWN